MKNRILVIGHSHMYALHSAEGAAESFHFISLLTGEKGDYAERDPDRFKALAAAGYTAVAFVLAGSRHISLGLLNPPSGTPVFDFYLPEDSSLPFNTAASVMPVDLVACLLKRHMRQELDHLAELSALFGDLPRYHIESPPPFPAEHIHQHPASFAELLQQRGLAPTTFRYKLWRLHSRLMRDFCTAKGITFMATPPGTQDESGCLAAPYRREDPTHANASYGALVLNQLCTLHGLPALP